MTTKTCGRCREKKDSTEFYSEGTSGFAGWCKVCRRADERRRRADPKLVSKFHDRYETDMDFRARELLRAVQKRCRRNGTRFDLDVPWFSKKLKGCCELTGLPFDMSVRTRRPQLYTPSIDRIRPGEGYTKDNCRVVLFGVNLMIKDFTLPALMPIVEALVQRHAMYAEVVLDINPLKVETTHSVTCSGSWIFDFGSEHRIDLASFVHRNCDVEKGES